MSRRRPRTKQVEVDRGKAALRFHKLDKLEQDGGLADAALAEKNDGLFIRMAQHLKHLTDDVLAPVKEGFVLKGVPGDVRVVPHNYSPPGA